MWALLRRAIKGQLHNRMNTLLHNAQASVGAHDCTGMLNRMDMEDGRKGRTKIIVLIKRDSKYLNEWQGLQCAVPNSPLKDCEQAADSRHPGTRCARKGSSL